LVANQLAIAPAKPQDATFPGLHSPVGTGASELTFLRPKGCVWAAGLLLMMILEVYQRACAKQQILSLEAQSNTRAEDEELVRDPRVSVSMILQMQNMDDPLQARDSLA
jgi:hypothetical protein